jgi:hypothetical protein
LRSGSAAREGLSGAIVGQIGFLRLACEISLMAASKFHATRPGNFIDCGQLIS